MQLQKDTAEGKNTFLLFVTKKQSATLSIKMNNNTKENLSILGYLYPQTGPSITKPQRAFLCSGVREPSLLVAAPGQWNNLTKSAVEAQRLKRNHPDNKAGCALPCSKEN